MVRFVAYSAPFSDWTLPPSMVLNSTPRPDQESDLGGVSVQSLGSGSSGNAFLIQTSDANLLLDCGVGIRTIQRALRPHNQQIDDLNAILVTHEHSDHIRSLSCVYGTSTPIIATVGTRRQANIPPPQWEEISFARSISIGSIAVWAIRVKHDAKEPCGYLIETSHARISVFTDLGSWHESLLEPIRASDLVVLESNHDLDMLWNGPYPAYLKRRVASSVGHLSNADCASSLATALARGATKPSVWLAHLSQTNNAPSLAEAATKAALSEAGLTLEVTALPRTESGPIWTPTTVPDATPWSPKRVLPILNQLSLDASF